MIENLTFNHFYSASDNEVAPLITSWSVLSDLLQEKKILADKADSQLFNLSLYREPADIQRDDLLVNGSTRRSNDNIIGIQALILDYDNDQCNAVDDDTHQSFDEICSKFAQYEFIAYTTHSNLTKGVERFRIIMPLKKPLMFNGDAEIWEQYIPSILEFAGPIDQSSLRKNQIHYLPSCSTSNETQFKALYNKGAFVSIDQFALTKAAAAPKPTRASTLDSSKPLELTADQHIETSQGLVRVGDVREKIEGVVCPFHTDRNGTEFVRHNHLTGHTYLYCKSCQKTYHMRGSKPKGLQYDYTDLDDEFLEYLYGEYIDATDRRFMQSKIRNIQKKIIASHNSKNKEAHIVITPEGGGKSHLIVTLATLGYNIIFAGKSWNQVLKKYDETLNIAHELGFEISLHASLAGTIEKRFGCKPVYIPSDNPYQIGNLDKDATIEAIQQSCPSYSYEFLSCFIEINKVKSEEVPMFDSRYQGNPSSIIFTTIMQANLMTSISRSVGKNWIVVFDDPDLQDAIDIAIVDTDAVDPDHVESSTNITNINQTAYYVRPRYLSTGAGYKSNTTIFTTTEELTTKALCINLAKRSERYRTHDVQHPVSGGDITILGSNIVRKSRDALVRLLHRRLEKNGFPLNLIADGLAAEINHSNNKGKNDLSDKGSLIELSIPHQAAIKTVVDAIADPRELPFNEVKAHMMQDSVHQALGRANGYRFKNNGASIVLTDPQMHARITKKCRYKINRKCSVIIDRTSGMARKESRLPEDASALVCAIDKFVNNIETYLLDFRVVKADIKYIFKSIEAPQASFKYLIRLLHAINNVFDLQLDEDEQKPYKGNKVKAILLAKWIVEEFSPQKFEQTISHLKTNDY